MLTALFVGYLFVYWVWDTANSQKNRFRQRERGTKVFRNAFPQLPWQTLEEPETITTPQGTILVDGWYGLARKVHYTCDLYFALNWGLITGFKSPFPWFYPLFFACMISHRCLRDIQRCRHKYGDAWKEYERKVPYLFIPVSTSTVPKQINQKLTGISSTLFRVCYTHLFPTQFANPKIQPSPLLHILLVYTYLPTFTLSLHLSTPIHT